MVRVATTSPPWSCERRMVHVLTNTKTLPVRENTNVTYQGDGEDTEERQVPQGSQGSKRARRINLRFMSKFASR